MGRIALICLLVELSVGCSAFLHQPLVIFQRFAELVVHNAVKSDPIREATGIRPSLHPTTINAIAEALKLRASGSKDYPLSVVDGDSPLDVMMSAGKIATEAICKRLETSQVDGMAFDEKECQTISGRVVGVAVRFDELEKLLFDRVSSAGWVKKYNEWSSFGVLEDESNTCDRIREDPLFTVSRAECLLALFLATIEAPTMEKRGDTVAGGSQVNFIDADRAEVLLDDS
mmetsp:Transcript_15552/g.26354  ORF Transcript_15552/g.26354 Transcript_15552/m.26354 type:complete len:230 (-) Transcript_15552:42-731(-)